MEEQEARFKLYSPGTLIFLKRWQEAPGARAGAGGAVADGLRLGGPARLGASGVVGPPGAWERPRAQPRGGKSAGGITALRPFLGKAQGASLR